MPHPLKTDFLFLVRHKFWKETKSYPGDVCVCVQQRTSRPDLLCGVELTSFKLIQHHIQLGVAEDAVHGMLVKLSDGFQRRAVVRIHEGQVFDEQDVHDVGPVVLVDRYAREAALHYVGHGAEVQQGVRGEHVAV